MSGTVYLIGAGPGDPELLTVKAYRLLRNVDVVFHDRLVSDEIVTELPDDVERVDCGKKAGNHRLTQEEINERLYQRAESGANVARLKGGDPLVFGRGGEEQRYLQDRGINTEIVPGITAATAASAELGVPLTDREIASEVTFMTGHEAPEKSAESLDWHCMATCRKTLVIYMGVNQLPNIAETLIEKGRDPETPALAVENATSNQQRTIHGTLESLPEQAEREDLTPPALIVIGEVGKFFSEEHSSKNHEPETTGNSPEAKTNQFSSMLEPSNRNSVPLLDPEKILWF